MPIVSPTGNSPVEVTVFIPTFNGEDYLGRLLDAVEQQDFAGGIEILIIDSGSTDATLGIIAHHPAVRLVQIPQSEFGHGKTRNRAAELARGEFIVYLSHDAVPLGTGWLSSLLTPLRSHAEGGNDAQAVFAKHVARSHCFPSLKYGIEGVFAACGPDGEVTVVDGAIADVSTLPASQLFYSDVCSATRRDFLLNTISYQDLPYSEDLAFAKDLLEAGYRKAYQPSAVVEHSNDVTLSEYPRRTFDEFLGMRRVGEAPSRITRTGMLARIVKEIALTSGKILVDAEYSLGRTTYWLFVNPAYVWGKWVGVYRALTVRLDDSSAIARNSLEAHRANVSTM